MALEELIQISSRLKMDFWKLIQIDLGLKKYKWYFDSNQFMTQKTFQYFFPNQLMNKKIWNIDLNHIMTQWFDSTVDFVDLFSAFTQCRFPFLVFSLNFVHLFGLPLNFADFFGHSTKCLDSNQLMTHAVSRRLESIQLKTQANFQEFTQNKLMTQVYFPGIDSYWTMTQSASPFFDWTQLMTQAKGVWFWVDSWFDSESYPCLPYTASI